MRRILAAFAIVLPALWLASAAQDAHSRLAPVTSASAARSNTTAGALAEERHNRELQIVAWTHALAVDPHSALSLSNLAALYMQRGRETSSYPDYVQAESLSRRSLALRENRNARTYATLASSLLSQHRFVDARVVAARMVALDPDEPVYQSILGEIDTELGNYDEAGRLLEPLFHNRGNPGIAARLARWAELTGRTHQARLLFVAARDDALSRRDVPLEQQAWFHYRLADFELRHGKVRTAEHEVREGLSLRPDDPRLLSALARVEFARERWREAAEAGEQSLAIAPDPATFGIVSDAWRSLGDSAKAADYERAMEAAVLAQPGAYHRAWSLFLLDHGRRVPEVLANAQAELTTRKDIYGLDLVAWALHRSGRDAEAAKYSARALALHTEDPVLLRHAAEIQRSLGSGDRKA